MDLLFICGAAPTAARPRPHGLIAALARGGHSVTLLFGDKAGTAFDGLTEHCSSLLPVRRSQLAAAVAETIRAGGFDLVHVDRSAAGLLPTRTTLPTVLDAGVCASLRHARELRSLGPVGRAARGALLSVQRRHEAAMLARFRRVVVAAEDDAAAFASLGSAGVENVHVVPSPVDAERFAPPLRLRDQATLLLDLRELGRAEALVATATLAAAMPLIWAQRAEVRLAVIGPLPLGATGRLAVDPRVVFTGAVHDPRGHLAAATLVVAPVEPAHTPCHSALEAMATGTALIASRGLARDLDARPGEELLVAETPAELARAALALLDAPPYRGRLGRAGRRLVERRHTWDATLAALEQVYSAATGSTIAAWRLEIGLDRLRRDEPEIL